MAIGYRPFQEQIQFSRDCKLQIAKESAEIVGRRDPCIADQNVNVCFFIYVLLSLFVMFLTIFFTPSVVDILVLLVCYVNSVLTLTGKLHQYY